MRDKLMMRSCLVVISILAACSPSKSIMLSTQQSNTPIKTKTVEEHTEFATSTSAMLELESPTPEDTSETNLDISLHQKIHPEGEESKDIIVATWDEIGEYVYYAVAPGIGQRPYKWFKIGLDGQNEDELPHPIIASRLYPVTPNFYPELEGLVSPHGRFNIEVEPGEMTDRGPVDADVWLVDTKGEYLKKKIIESAGANFRRAEWTEDENVVVIGMGPEFGTDLYHINIKLNETTMINEIAQFNDPGLLEETLSPDGQYLAIVDGNGNLNLINIPEGRVDVMKGFFQNLRWADEGPKLFYYKGTGWHEAESLNSYSVSSNEENTIWKMDELENEGIAGFFEVSPDGDRILFWEPRQLWVVAIENN